VGDAGEGATRRRHRVVGAGFRLVGFSANGGIATKLKLLQIEGWRAKEPMLFEELV
jgi:methylated-DNA-[protein]-cysteine S-methyltransferase